MRWLIYVGILLVTGGACQGRPTATPATPAATPSLTPPPPIGVTLATRPSTLNDQVLVAFTPTPLPTATPTPSPTPIVYAIQAGDTLWDVAYLNRTSVEEIVALNPGLRPEALQIGQLLLLPPPATPVYTNVRGTPAPLQLELLTLRLYRTPLGSGWILGELINHSPWAAEQVAVGLTLWDAAGLPLGEVVAWAIPGLIGPQQRAPFGVLINELPPLPAGQPEQVRVAAAIVGGEAVLDPGNRYLDLSAEVEHWQRTEERVDVAAQIRNTGALTATQVQITATFYDASGAVSGFAQMMLRQPLPPAAAAAITLNSAPPGGQTVAVQLTAQGLSQATP